MIEIKSVVIAAVLDVLVELVRKLVCKKEVIK